MSYLATISPSAASLASRIGSGWKLLLLQASSLSPEERKEIDGAIEDLEEAKKTWEWIEAAIADAEEMQIHSISVRKWMLELRDMADKILELHDMYEYEVTATQVSLASQKQDTVASSGPPPPKEAPAAGNLKEPTPEVRFPTVAPLLDTSFRREFLDRVRKIKRQFDWIAKQRAALSLKQSDCSRHLLRDSTNTDGDRVTGSIPDSVFVGRGKELADLRKLLLPDPPAAAASVEVIAVIGMGGIGKTTLAQHAYNDSDVNRHFDRRGWVYVSPKFDVVRLTKAVIEALSGKHPKASELSVLQGRVEGLVLEEKILLVLDDVWNEDRLSWERFIAPLGRSAGRGSRILLTTRLPQVAVTAGVVNCICLKKLPGDEEWDLFKRHAFRNYNDPGIRVSEEIQEMGRKIVKRCGGLPLAVKVVGSLLRCKGLEEDGWRSVLESSLLEFSHREGEIGLILGSLYLSYLHLSPKLRACFLLISTLLMITARHPLLGRISRIIAKGFNMPFWQLKTKHVTSLLMAYDIAEHAGDASRCIEELKSRFFINHDENRGFSMHDLFHDLARYILGGEEHQTTECGHGHLLLAGSRHASIRFSANCHLLVPSLDGGCNPKLFSIQQSLRSLQVYDSCWSTSGYLFQQEMRSLRALHLSTTAHVPPPWLLDRKYSLRYLDLSGRNIQKLPDCIGNLRNLQDLSLCECPSLEELPASIINLTNLHSLSLPDRHLISHFPSGFGSSLLKIQHLTYFLCPGSHASSIKAAAGLAELRHMVQLQDKIRIHNLAHASVDGARDAEMANKRHLRQLQLSWRSRQQYYNHSVEKKDNQVLEFLRPHHHIEKLKIYGYTGSRLPSWMGDESFSRLVSLCLSRMDRCASLSPVHRLPSLEILKVKLLNALVEVVPDGLGVRGSAGLPFFPSLQKLSIFLCHRLHTVFLYHVTSLKELRLDSCGQLKGFVPPQHDASSLEIVRIRECLDFAYVDDPALPPRSWELCLSD